MNFNIHFIESFKKSFKRLGKKYRSIGDDLIELTNSLKENPFQGDELFPGVRKIRMGIKSKGKGKSGGARVITYTVVFTEQEGEIYFIEIYDKAVHATVDEGILKAIISDLQRELK